MAGANETARALVGDRPLHTGTYRSRSFGPFLEAPALPFPCPCSLMHRFWTLPTRRRVDIATFETIPFRPLSHLGPPRFIPLLPPLSRPPGYPALQIRYPTGEPSSRVALGSSTPACLLTIKPTDWTDGKPFFCSRPIGLVRCVLSAAIGPALRPSNSRQRISEDSRSGRSDWPRRYSYRSHAGSLLQTEGPMARKRRLTKMANHQSAWHDAEKQRRTSPPGPPKLAPGQ